MKRLLRRWWFWLVAPLVIGPLGLLAFCQYHRVWSLRQWGAYQMMAEECHPVWHEYHFGRIHAGESVDEVIARTRPGRVERNGRWTILTYPKQPLAFSGLTAWAYDGRMVCAMAASCTWMWSFFDDLTDEQSVELFGRGRDDPQRFGGFVPVNTSNGLW